MTKNLKLNYNVVRKMELPYPGDILVEVGQEVKPETLVAKTELLDIQPGYFDVAYEFDLEVESKEMKDVWQVEVGSYVDRGDILAKYQDKEIVAPYYGYVEHISYSGGYLLLRQKVSENEEPLVINLAEEMGVHKKLLSNIMQVDVGDHVIRSSGIAGDIKIVRTPMTGEVIDISFDDGTVTIKPYYKPTLLYAGVYGKVVDVIDNFAVKVQTEIDFIEGVFGIGQDVTAKLVTKGQEEKDSLVFIDGQLQKDDLLKAEREGVAGIIATSAHAKDLIDYFGNEIMEGVTGLVKRKFSVVLVSGFGVKKLTGEVSDLIKAYQGKKITINPATNMQTPVKKPSIYLYKNQ